MKEEEIIKFIENYHTLIPTLGESIEISKKYAIPLHPRYTLYWNELSSTELVSFLEFIKKEIKAKIEDNKINYLIFPNNEFKKCFENIALEHHTNIREIERVKAEKEIEMIVIADRNVDILFSNLGILDLEFKNLDNVKKHIDKIIEFANQNLDLSSVEIISENNIIGIRDKGGSYVGARMGRPEKAKMRKMDGRPHGLFPVGDEGGRLRNLIEAHTKHGKITGEFAIFKDGSEESVYPVNSNGEKLEKIYFERYTDREVKQSNEKAVRYKKVELKTDKYINEVRKLLGSVELPQLIKGIRGTSNKDHIVEHMVKSFIRAKNDVYVNKDGTVRYDMIEMGLTHFRAKEIGTSIEKLKELGYKRDYEGRELVDENQLIEIFPQDVILPDCIESGDELASNYIINTGNFVDELLERLYKLRKFYNFKTKEDTIGHLIIGLAPHTSAGIIGRIIGYSKSQGCFSHPVWHAAQRRNLDGDENGIMLLLDGLINFSREYLPDRRGTRSVTSDTVIFIEENGEIKSVEIGEYIDNIFKNNQYIIDDEGFQTLNPKKLKALSFDKNGKVLFNKINQLIRHKCDKDIYEIKTSEGWIRTTQDHSVFIVDYETGKIEEKTVSELKKNDFIITLGKINLKRQNAKKIKIDNLNINFDIRSSKMPAEIKFDEVFFELLGFIYAEGHIKGNKIEIGNTKLTIIEKMKRNISLICGTEVNINLDRRESKYTSGKYYRINIPSNLVRILKTLGVEEEKAKDKKIPPFVYNSSKENIYSFLSGYCLGDGTSYFKDKERNSIRLYTSSKILASGLSLLGFLCGKRSTCRKSIERNGELKYEVFVANYKDRTTFWPIRHLRKEINEGLKKSNIGIKEKTLLLSNIVFNSRIKSSSKTKISKIISALEKSKENKKLILKLKNIIEQDIRVEIVNSITKINYEGYIYDLEVPGTQNFLCGPHPIFAHNTMDTSLVLTSHLYLDQIDDEVHGMDIVFEYPLEMYKAAKKYKHPKEVKIEKVGSRIEEKDEDTRYFGYGFTHNTTDMNLTNMCSSYKSVPLMKDKMEMQLQIAKKIRAVDENQVGTLIIDKHFMKDIKGNLRKFGMQSFRCTNCNEILRRPPLNAKCPNCKAQSINFTIHEGSVKKYLEPSFKIVDEYDVDPYIVEVLELANLRIEGVFGKQKDKQKSLSNFFESKT